MMTEAELEQCALEMERETTSQGELADVGMPFLTLQGSTLMAVGPCEGDHTSSSLRLVMRGPRQRRHVSSV